MPCFSYAAIFLAERGGKSSGTTPDDDGIPWFSVSWWIHSLRLPSAEVVPAPLLRFSLRNARPSPRPTTPGVLLYDAGVSEAVSRRDNSGAAGSHPDPRAAPVPPRARELCISHNCARNLHGKRIIAIEHSPERAGKLQTAAGARVEPGFVVEIGQTDPSPPCGIWRCAPLIPSPLPPAGSGPSNERCPD